MKLTAPTSRSIRLRAVRANAGVARWYQAELERKIHAMAENVTYWILRTWRANPPVTTLAQDASSVNDLASMIRKLSGKWTREFDDLSEKLATKFADKTVMHTNVGMQQALIEKGFTVRFQPSQATVEAMRNIVAQNVSMISSIAPEYLFRVETQVWLSAQAGHDVARLTRELTAQYGITYRRAKIIAHDQNNKAHAAIEAERRAELGIEKAEWVHSGAGKHPRPSHVAAGKDRLVFKVREGAYLDGEWVRPGEAINCRCTSHAIIPGLEGFAL